MSDDEPVLYSIEPGHLEQLRAVAKRLYTENRMTGDEMRDAAHAVMSVVRFAEALEALRPPGEPYAHMSTRVAPVRTPEFVPQHQAESKLLRARSWVPDDDCELVWRKVQSGTELVVTGEYSHDAAVANVLMDAGWRREDDRSRWFKPKKPEELFTTGHAVEVELAALIPMTPEHDS